MIIGYYFLFFILVIVMGIKVFVDEDLWKWILLCILIGVISFIEFWERNLVRFIKMKLYIFLI